MDATKEAILAQLMEGREFVRDTDSFSKDGPYGVGDWPEAALEEVIPQEKNQYGYQMTLKFDLLGIGGGKPFKHFQALASSEDEEYWQKRNGDNAASVAHVGGLFPGVRLPVIQNQADYDFIVNAFRVAIGEKFPLKIRPRDEKRVWVWGLKARR